MTVTDSNKKGHKMTVTDSNKKGQRKEKRFQQKKVVNNILKMLRG